MNPQNQVSNSPFKTVFSIADEMKPLKKRKNPALAASLGFFTGGIGLGIYLGSRVDFFLPLGMFLLIALVSGGTLLELAPFFWAYYGFRRAKASNRKLDAGGNAERILEAEVITEPPPIPAVPRAIDSRKTPQARLRRLDDLLQEGVLSQSEYAQKRADILREI